MKQKQSTTNYFNYPKYRSFCHNCPQNDQIGLPTVAILYFIRTTVASHCRNNIWKYSEGNEILTHHPQGGIFREIWDISKRMQKTSICYGDCPQKLPQKSFP